MKDDTTLELTESSKPVIIRLYGNNPNQFDLSAKLHRVLLNPESDEFKGMKIPLDEVDLVNSNSYNNKLYNHIFLSESISKNVELKVVESIKLISEAYWEGLRPNYNPLKEVLKKIINPQTDLRFHKSLITALDEKNDKYNQSIPETAELLLDIYGLNKSI